jgi:hypothetical protein
VSWHLLWLAHVLSFRLILCRLHEVIFTYITFLHHPYPRGILCYTGSDTCCCAGVP